MLAERFAKSMNKKFPTTRNQGVEREQAGFLSNAGYNHATECTPVKDRNYFTLTENTRWRHSCRKLSGWLSIYIYRDGQVNGAKHIRKYYSPSE